MANTEWSLSTVPEMDAFQFRQWQLLLEQRTGMCLPEERKSFLLTGLRARMRELDLAEYQQYYELLVEGPTGTAEWLRLVDRLTVQETRFFRHQGSFEFVGQYLARLNKTEPLALWSVGCSSGEEAWSLAITAFQQLPVRTGGRRFGVIGTDISLPALALARGAVYHRAKLEALPDTLRERYFHAVDEQRFEVNDVLRERVCFAQLNVLDIGKAPMQGQDVIFCQNLLIYFRRWRRREILSALARCLVPGGILVIGPGEMVDWTHPLLERVESSQVLAWRRRETEQV